MYLVKFKFLETGQLCLIFISKGQFLLKKFIQGHKGQKGQWRPKKVIKGQNFKKSLISSIFNVKSSINGKVILRKSCFSKIENFHFHNIKFLKLHINPTYVSTALVSKIPLKVVDISIWTLLDSIEVSTLFSFFCCSRSPFFFVPGARIGFQYLFLGLSMDYGYPVRLFLQHILNVYFKKVNT